MRSFVCFVLDRRFQVFDHVGIDRLKLEDPIKALSHKTSCTSFNCRWLLRNAVSYHLHFRRRSVAKNIKMATKMAESHRKMHLLNSSWWSLPCTQRLVESLGLNHQYYIPHIMIFAASGGWLIRAVVMMYHHSSKVVWLCFSEIFWKLLVFVNRPSFSATDEYNKIDFCPTRMIYASNYSWSSLSCTNDDGNVPLALCFFTIKEETRHLHTIVVFDTNILFDFREDYGILHLAEATWSFCFSSVLWLRAQGLEQMLLGVYVILVVRVNDQAVQDWRIEVNVYLCCLIFWFQDL